jgi:nucleotide-binding universal stress UspA family protein
MLKSILVGLDGSEYSEGALRVALEWAKEHSAVLGGVAVVDIPGIFQGEAVPMGAEQAKEALDQAQLADARKHVDQFLSDCAAKACGVLPGRAPAAIRASSGWLPGCSSTVRLCPCWSKLLAMP